jgi:hypothetical protein
MAGECPSYNRTDLMPIPRLSERRFDSRLGRTCAVAFLDGEPARPEGNFA